MATQTDLWGDIQPSAIRTPVAILREQAALLGNKTQNLVEARVRTLVFAGSFHLYFELVAPALNDYTYCLFELEHGPAFYPVRVRPSKELQTEEQLVDWLRRRLSSDETKKIVGNLLAQATS